MTLSQPMLAMEISAPGGPDVLKPVTVPVPVPGHGQIVVRLAYAGVNRPDALQRAGPMRRPPLPRPCRGWKGRALWWPWARGSIAGRSAIRCAPCFPAAPMPNTPPATRRTPCPFPQD